MADFPLIQGRAKSWASIEIMVDGLPPITGFVSLKWNDKLTPKKGTGTGSKPKYRSRGTYDADAEISGYKDVIDSLRQSLALRAAVLGVGYKLYEFTIIGKWSEQDLGPISTVTIEKCRIEEETDDESEGEDLAKTVWKLNVMNILRDGLDSVEPSL